jgi:hypothetical protein
MALSARMQQLFTRVKQSAARMGYDAVLTSGERTCSEQARVNPTEPCSYHLTGDAIDVALFARGSVPGFPGTPPIFGPVYSAKQAQGNLAFEFGKEYRYLDESDHIHFDDGRRLAAPGCCGPSGAAPGRARRVAVPRSKAARRRKTAPRKISVTVCECCGAPQTAHKPRRTSLQLYEPPGDPTETEYEED